MCHDWHDCFMTSVNVSPGMNHIDGGLETVMWSQNSHASTQNSHAGHWTVIVTCVRLACMACVAAIRCTQLMSSSNKYMLSK